MTRPFVTTYHLPEDQLTAFLNSWLPRRRRDSAGYAGGIETRPSNGLSRGALYDRDIRKNDTFVRGPGHADGKDDRWFIQRRVLRLAVNADTAPGITIPPSRRKLKKLAMQRYGRR